MVTQLAPKLALTTVAAVALYVPTLVGLPLPDSCAWTAAVAGAAPAPSPSCGGDLRECLRAKADMHPGWNFGVRYVTAEDVADCMEAFRSCTSGGARSGGNQNPTGPTSRGGTSSTPGSPTATGGGAEPLPQRFSISYARPLDCQRSGDSINCTGTYEEQRDNDTYTEKYGVSGTVSGMTMTGTLKGHSDAIGFCVSHTEYSASVTYGFKSDGTVAISQGSTQMQTVYSGGCADSPPSSSTSPPVEFTASWSAAR